MKLPDVSRLKYDAKNHLYELDGRKLSGVTSVLDGTSSKSNLISWAANCACDHIKEWCEKNFASVSGAVYEERVKEIRPLVVPDKTLAQVIEEARTAHTRKKESAGKKGTDVHGLVELFIQNILIGDADLAFNSPSIFGKIQPFVEWARDNKVEFLAAEQRLYSEKYGYAGTADFVCLLDGKLTIGDLKTFPKMWSADPFVQCGAYSLAWKELTGEAPAQSVIVKMCDPEDPRIKKYGNSPFAVYPRYAMEADEQMFLKRLEIYRYNQNFVSPD